MVDWWEMNCDGIWFKQHLPKSCLIIGWKSIENNWEEIIKDIDSSISTKKGGGKSYLLASAVYNQARTLTFFQKAIIQQTREMVGGYSTQSIETSYKFYKNT